MEKEVAFLALTIATELPVAMVVLGKRNWQYILLAVICVNFITHPIAWHFVTRGSSWFAVEAMVTATEAMLFFAIFPLTRRRAVAVGITMNIASALIGVVFF